MCQPTTATANKTGWTVRYDHRAEANWILCPAVHGCKFSGWSAGVVGRLLTKGMSWRGGPNLSKYSIFCHSLARVSPSRFNAQIRLSKAMEMKHGRNEAIQSDAVDRRSSR